MQLSQFLRTVLPAQGYKCWVSIDRNKKVRQGFTKSYDELADKLLEIDAEGLDAYFGCSAFATAGNRLSGNALGARAFWLDIDCGVEKAAKGLGYASYDIAVQALDDFANSLELPLPMVVCSGAGIHAYWLLENPAPSSDWLPVARALKLATERYGLIVDPSRTSDAASILRPPGTHNYKRVIELKGPRERVYVDEESTENISLADFYEKIKNVSLQIEPAKQTSPLANILNSRPAAISEGVSEGGRNQACAKYVGVLFAQGKDPETVLKEALAWNLKNKPPLADQEVRNVVNSIGRAQAAKPVAEIPITVDSTAPRPKLPQGFSAKAGGAMFAQIEDENGERKTVPMCAFEVYLMDVCRRENENKESYVFAAYHPHNGWHTFLVTREDFEGSSWLSIMGSNCTDIINPKLFKQYVRMASVERKGRQMDSVRYEQFGWKEDYQAFLVGNSLIRRGGQAVFAYGDDNLEPRMKGLKLKPNTSRIAWSVAANKMYASGFEAHGFGLLTSFAAPLMAFLCGATDGGAIFAMHTQGSGFGKTNTLQAIASVWGSYDALAIGGCDTENAKFAIISKARNLPIYEEEMGNIDPFKAAEIVKRFTNGKDKNRARRDGSVEYKDTRFQTIMISASNYSLADILRMSGDSGAMARVFEVTLDAPPNKESFMDFSNVTSAMLANYGHVGREYISGLLLQGKLEWAQQALLKLNKHYDTALQGSSKDRYVIYLLACCHVAAILVNAMGLLNFDTNRIMAWALEKAKLRTEALGTLPAPEVINQFINEHIMDALVVESAFSPRKPALVIRHPKNKLIMRMEREGGKLYISQSVLEAWLLKGNIHMATLAKELKREGILECAGKQITLGAGTDYSSGRIVTWEICMDHPAVSGMMQAVKKELPGAESLASNRMGI